MRIEVVTPEEGVNCEECGAGIKAHQFCMTWDGNFFDTSECLGSYMEKHVGKDFIAAQDQAVASVTEAMKKRPNNFILFYEDEQDGQEAISTVVMAHPNFVAACLPILVESSQMQGTIEPPE